MWKRNLIPSGILLLLLSIGVAITHNVGHDKKFRLPWTPSGGWGGPSDKQSFLSHRSAARIARDLRGGKVQSVSFFLNNGSAVYRVKLLVDGEVETIHLDGETGNEI